MTDALSRLHAHAQGRVNAALRNIAGAQLLGHGGSFCHCGRCARSRTLLSRIPPLSKPKEMALA